MHTPLAYDIKIQQNFRRRQNTFLRTTLLSKVSCSWAIVFTKKQRNKE